MTYSREYLLLMGCEPSFELVDADEQELLTLYGIVWQ